MVAIILILLFLNFSFSFFNDHVFKFFRYSANSTNTHIKVKGEKQIVTESSYQVYENELFYQVVIHIPNLKFSSTDWATTSIVPAPYRPRINVELLASDKQVKSRFTSVGEIQVINLTTTQRETRISGIVTIPK